MPSPQASTQPSPSTGGSLSGIRDNHSRGTVGDFLRAQLRPGADLDLVTAYFTVFAYDKLRSHLDALGRIRLLFGEAAFIKNVDPDRRDPAAYVIIPLVEEQPQEDEAGFDLVTWLVVHDGASQSTA